MIRDRARAVSAVIVLILVGLSATPAGADHCDNVTGGGGSFSNGCLHTGGEQGESDQSGKDTDPAGRGDIYNVESRTVDGERCWMITDDGTMSWAEATDMLASFNDNGTLYDSCDFGTDTPPSVWTFWIEERCPPPPPTPVTLDPQNEAVTGKPGHLTIGGNRTEAIECLGQVINAEARYVIHWGDGSTTETTSQGGEWPDGDLTHVYEDKGSYTITVEAYWTGTVGGTALPELPVPTTATADIQVDEVQAVVTEQH